MTSVRLLAYEDSGEWQQTARSYSEWIRSEAKGLGTTAPLLWRYKSAALFYNERREAASREGIEWPVLDKLSPKVSAETLELLSKLFRVAPEDVYARLEQGVVLNGTTKKEVQQAWNAYAPLLNGITKRGRGARDAQVPVQRGEQEQADLVRRVSTSNGEWIDGGVSSFRYFRGQEFEHDGSALACDAVIVSRKDRSSPAAIHGLVIRKRGESISRALARLCTGCDVNWIADRAEIKGEARQSIPPHVGILTLGDPIVVSRNPESATPIPSEPLIRQLLTRLC